MKYLFAVFAVFFLAPVPIPLLAQAQENIVVLPPIAKSRTPPTPPPQEMRKILVVFREHYRNELCELTASDQPPDSWLVLVILMPECKDYKGWCIEIVAAKKKKGAKVITITQVPISDKAAFDSAAEAKKAAKKTKEKITGRPSLTGNPFRQLAEQLALERKGGDNRWRVDIAGLLALLIK